MKHAIPILLIICFPIVVSADTIHVPADQPTIQAGIDAAVDGDTVQVADGRYTGPGNRDIDFLGKAITVRSENGAENCIIDCEGSESDPHRGFGFGSGEGPDSVLEGFTIQNGHEERGGAIHCFDSSPTITGNIIKGNTALDFGIDTYGWGGGIFCAYNSHQTLIDNTITGNLSVYGGGIYAEEASSLTIINNNITENSAVMGGTTVLGIGGGICLWGGSLTVINSTIAGNESDNYYGGIYCFTYDGGSITNSIIWDNNPWGLSFVGEVTYSDVQVGGGWPGEGNIYADPLFVTGPDGGEYYLSQIAAGQSEDSPCVDAGDPDSDLVQGTTRTDLVQDWGTVDMGYHYPREVEPFITAGAGPSHDNPALVRIYPAEPGAEPLLEFHAYEAPFGVNVTCGNMNLDAMDEILTGPGPGPVAGPNVRGFQLDGTPLSGLNFFAYGTLKYGVNVATGDIDGDSFDEIITGAGPGAVFGPHVRGWDYDGSGSVTAIPGVSFFAYGTPKWGVNVATGDIDGDGYDEIVTGAGPGAVYGPHVRGWDYDGAPPVTPIPGCSFFAYGTLKYGVNVTCGDLDGDGIDEIVTGAGPGAVFAPHVRGWNYDGSTVVPLPGLSFFAWDDMRYGANVFAGADLNGDGRAELVVGCGPDPDAGTEVKVYEYDGSAQTLWFSLEAFEGMYYGTNMAAGSF